MEIKFDEKIYIWPAVTRLFIVYLTLQRFKELHYFIERSYLFLKNEKEEIASKEESHEGIKNDCHWLTLFIVSSTKLWTRPQKKKIVKNLSGQEIVIKDDCIWRGINYALNTMELLVKVLRIENGNNTIAMGFIYKAINKIKE